MTANTQTALQSRAEALYHALERRTRDNGNDFYTLKDGSPEWMRDVIHAAHGPDLMPDDWRYSFINDCAGSLFYEDDPDEIELEADVYTGRLTDWLASNINRVYYLEEAMTEYRPDSGFALLQLAQLKEREETMQLLREALEELAEEDETSGTDEDTEDEESEA